jgi:predicted double-glycine peptidase
MKTKLTLTIDQKVIERARVRSRKEGRSISQMFEDTFSNTAQGQSANISTTKQDAARHFIELMNTQKSVKAFSDEEESRLKASHLSKKHG